MTQEEQIALLTESRFPLIPFAWAPYGVTFKSQLSAELAANCQNIEEIQYGHSHIEISTGPKKELTDTHYLPFEDIKKLIILFLASKDIDPVMVTEYVIEDRQNRSKYILDINFILP